jgi:hypothetical protein
MIALELGDVNLVTRQVCIRRSDWNGHVTTPKSGRPCRVPLTRRLTTALRDHRHLRTSRVLCRDNTEPLTRQMVQSRVKRASRRAALPHDGVHILRPHVLLASGDARSAGAGDSGTGTTR